MSLQGTRVIDHIMEEYSLLFPNDTSYFYIYLTLLNKSGNINSEITREMVLDYAHKEDAELDADYERFKQRELKNQAK